MRKRWDNYINRNYKKLRNYCYSLNVEKGDDLLQHTICQLYTLNFDKMEKAGKCKTDNEIEGYIKWCCKIELFSKKSNFNKTYKNYTEITNELSNEYDIILTENDILETDTSKIESDTLLKIFECINSWDNGNKKIYFYKFLLNEYYFNNKNILEITADISAMTGNYTAPTTLYNDLNNAIKKIQKCIFLT